MKQPSLKSKLQALGEAANELTDDTLNYGGCCVYAALVGRELEKLGVPVRGVVKTSGSPNIDEVRNNVSNVDDPVEWNNAGLYFHHVGLEAKLGRHTYILDSETMRPAKERALGYAGRVADGYLSVDEMEKLAGLGVKGETRHKRGWNSWFDRRHIPALRELVSTLGEEVSA